MKRLVIIRVTLLVAAVGNIAACRGTGNVCNDAIDLCGAGQQVSDDLCVADQRQYAECIVDRGACDPATASECAGGAGAFGGTSGAPLPGAGPADGSTAAIALEIIKSSYLGDGYFDVEAKIRNVGESTPVPVQRSLFFVEDGANNLHTPSGGVCHGGAALAQGGEQRCELQYSVPPGFTARRLVFRDPLSRQAVADFPQDAAACPMAAEDTLATCSDGCSNDGDKFVDCDDYDCCAVRPDCPASSSCGRRQQDPPPDPTPSCQPGPEDNLAACSDGCSNDGDEFVDCDDYDCCAVRPDCPASSACAYRP